VGLELKLTPVLHGVATQRLNEQVRRNLARFPADFMFQLDAQEAQSLRLQFATLDKAGKDGKPGRGRYSKYLPIAFTEHGAIMAARRLAASNS
jgi:ORF6N domain